MASSFGFDAHFVTDLNDEFACPICHLAMRDPLLTHCGHQFCTSCLKPLYHREGVQCPVCRLYMKQSLVYPNNALKRKVLDLQIRCDRSSDGCEWVGELRSRDQHNAKCGYVPEPCLNDCSEIVLRKDMDNHMQLSCLRRVVECAYCEEGVAARDLPDHHKACDMFPVACQFNCGAHIARGMMERHVSRQGTCPNSELTCKFADEGCNFRGVRGRLEMHMKAETTQHLDLVTAKLSKVTEQMSKFEYIWKIENWSQKVAEARTAKGRFQSSPTIYNGHPGYNMQICIHPHWCGDDFEMSYVSVSLYMSLMKGKYDRLLRWPFNKSFSLTILDQTPDGNDLTELFDPYDYGDSFDSPNENDGFGSAEFASHELLAKNHYIEDDSIMIKLTVFN